MLQIREIDVAGKRRAVVISSDSANKDEVALLEVIWDALGEYETEERRIRGIRARWTLATINSAISEIVLVYPSLFGYGAVEVEEKAVRRRKKKKASQTPQA